MIPIVSESSLRERDGNYAVIGCLLLIAALTTLGIFAWIFLKAV
jgi:hypothetical protein